jgi:hypothetical protein
VTEPNVHGRPLPNFEQALAYRPRDAAVVAGISLAGIYEAMAAGKLQNWKVGGKRMIDPQSLRKFVRGED